jgi:hypothetical protein
LKPAKQKVNETLPHKNSWVWWYTPDNLHTQEAEPEGSWSKAGLAKVGDPMSKTKKSRKGPGHGSGDRVLSSPSNHEVLSSSHSTAKI